MHAINPFDWFSINNEWRKKKKTETKPKREKKPVKFAINLMNDQKAFQLGRDGEFWRKGKIRKEQQKKKSREKNVHFDKNRRCNQMNNYQQREKKRNKWRKKEKWMKGRMNESTLAVISTNDMKSKKFSWKTH